VVEAHDDALSLCHLPDRRTTLGVYTLTCMTHEYAMIAANRAITKLEAIHQLWMELRRAKENTPEHEMLMEKIRVLSAEYQALVDAAKNPEKPE
jgi:hypothetical protein